MDEVRPVRRTHDLAGAAVQMAAIAELDRSALTTVDLGCLLERAVNLIAHGLGVELADVWEQGRDEAVVRLGVGWPAGVVGSRVEVRPGSHLAFTLGADSPVVVADLGTEDRFRPAAHLLDHNVRASMAVAISTADGPMRVLGAHTTEPRVFGRQDQVFLQTMAQVVAHTVVRRPQRELRLLVDGVGDHAICLIGPDGRISTWNAGAERMNGYPSADAIGRHLSFLYSDEDVAAGKPERALAVARAEGRLAQQVWQVRRGGSRFLADVVITAVRDDHGELQGFANVTREVTERHELQRELLEAQKLEAVGCLAARAAHDFKNFLTGVRGYVELLMPKVGDRDDLRDDLRKIGEAGGRASKMVDQLLVLSRGEEVLEPQVLDLRTAVRSAELLVRHAVDVDVEVHVVLGDEPFWVRADPAQVERILLNLAMNARDAMPRAARSPSARPSPTPSGTPRPAATWR